MDPRYPNRHNANHVAERLGSMDLGSSMAPSVVSDATDNAGPEGMVFWPDLRAKLTTDASLRNLTLSCPVCVTSMRAQATSSRNVARILPCGHILCSECVIRICANVDNPVDNPNARPPECPFCKEGLGKYPHCGESCQNPGRIGHGLPQNMEEMRNLPRTIPEGGSRPGCCKRCRILRVERLSRRLVRVILNEEKARAVWFPCIDTERQGEGDHSDYITVPELEPLLEALASALHDQDIHQKYTQLYPYPFQERPRAMAEMIDRKRDSL